MKIIIDRFEGDSAVVELPGKVIINVPKILFTNAKEGDVISIMETSRKKEFFKGLAETLASKNVPAWLVLDAQNMSGKVDRFPTREEIDVPVAEQSIVELYSK